MSQLSKAILLGLIAAFGSFDYQMGTLYLFRPIILGPLAGLVLGDLQQGLIIGANLELMFLGAISVGAYIPPDVIVGGVLGTAFAITSGQGVETAIALALPVALLSLAIENFIQAVVYPFMLRMVDSLAEKGNTKGITFIHYLMGFIICLTRFLLVFLAFKLGASKVAIILDKIPEVLTQGMSAAAGLLPAFGFAMLMRMILTKKLAPYYILGFVLAAYLDIPVLGVAILGVILILIKFDFLNPKIVQKMGGMEDDDF